MVMMHKFSLILFLATIAVSAGFIAAGETVTGKVVDPDTGNGVAGVRVALLAGTSQDPWTYYAPDGSAAREAESGQDGTFSFADVAPGKWAALVFDETHAGMKPAFFPVESGQTPAPLILNLITGCHISGKILREDTEDGVGGVTIDMEAKDSSRNSWVFSTTSQPNGNFRSVALPSGRYDITLPAGQDHILTDIIWQGESALPNGVVMEGRFSVAPAKQINDLRIVVKPGAAVDGIVVDVDGTPVEGAIVRENDGRYCAAEGARHVVTGPDGAFSMKGYAPDEQVSMEAFKGNLVSRTIETCVAGKSDCRLVLVPESVLAGVVVDEDGTAVMAEEDDGVRIQKEGSNISPYCRAEIGSDGRFRIGRLRAGNYTLEPSIHKLTPREEEETEVTLKEGESAIDLKVVVTNNRVDGPIVSGEVVDEQGNPVVHAGVRTGMTLGSTLTDKNGRFTLHLGPTVNIAGAVENESDKGKKHLLRAAADGYVVGSTDVEAGDKDVRVVLQKSGQIEGRVVYKETQMPVADFTVRASVTGGTNKDTYAMDDWDADGANGTFTIEDIVPGEITITAEHGPASKAETKAEVKPGETARVLLELPMGASIKGIVTDAEGNGIGKAYIIPRSTGGDKNREEGAWVETNADGTFELTGLAPGPVKLVVRSDIYPQATATVQVTDAKTTETRIVLTKGGTVSGRVTVGGKPLANVGMGLSTVDGSWRSAGGRTDRDGRYVFQEVPPGEMRVYASWLEESGMPDGRELQKTVTMEQDSSCTADLDFIPGSATLELDVQVPASMPRQEPDKPDVEHVKLVAYLTVILPTGDETHVLHIRGRKLTLQDLPPGKTRLTVSCMSGEDTRVRSFEKELLPNDNWRLDVDFPDGYSISGTISDAKAGEPAMYSIRAMFGEYSNVADCEPNRDKPFEFRVRLAAATRAENGRFELQHLLPGTYTLLVFKSIGMGPGAVPQKEPLEMKVIKLESQDVTVDF